MSVVWADSLGSPPRAHPRRRGTPAAAAPCRVAILGFGNVGRSLARLIARSPVDGILLTRIANRDIDRKRVDWLPPSIGWSDSLHDAVHARDVDLVVELLGGLEPALTCIREALASGKSVVTANKQVMARHGAALFDLAAKSGAELRCEGAAGGAVPIVRALAESLRADRVTRIAAVLNGTSNFVLERRASGASLADAVEQAQALGIAEADPSADLDGDDAAAKLALLSLFAFGARVDPAAVPRASVRAIRRADFALAQRLGLVLKPVAYIARGPENHAVDAWSGPALVARSSPLASVQGARNAIIVSGEHSGETILAGEGAGGEPTAVAVLSDVMSIARGGCWRPPVVAKGVAACQAPVLPHVVRLAVPSRADGVPPVVAGLHAHGLQVGQVMTLAGDARAAHVALGVDACRTADVRRALGAMQTSVAFQGAAVMPILTGDTDVGRV